MSRVTLSRFVSESLSAPAEAALPALLDDVASACADIAAVVSDGALVGALGDAGAENAQGERQKKLDVVANDLLLRACEWGGNVAALASEELAAPVAVPALRRGGDHLLVVDPLDGSSNLDVNVSVGTIFSVLRRPGSGFAVPEGEFLQEGVRQVCAGYAIYGPQTMLVLTLGRGVNGFTLDRERREFVLTHPDLRIPEETREFAINASNERHWEAPVRRYVSECLAGGTGPRGVDFNMRWIASLVAEVHRILVRGGVFMYPRDARDPSRRGRLRLLYEASPMAMIVEQAGGAASTGRERLLEVRPTELHQRIPVLLGSRREVERLVRYHRSHDEGEEPFRDPLFNVRSLFWR